MFLRKLAFLFVLFCSLSKGYAQFDAHFNNYFAITGYYNPAYSGNQNKLNIYGTYSLQLAGFTNAPQSMFAGVDVPFKLFGKKQGAGVGLFTESIGLFTNQRIWAQYAYRTSFLKGTLSFGAQLGALNVSFDPTEIDFGTDSDTSTDPAFPSATVKGLSLDVGLGVFYQHPKFYAGLSAAHLSAPTLLLGETNEMKINSTIYFTSGCNIQTTNPLLSIRPSMLLETDLTSYKLDLTGRLFYKKDNKTFYGGLSYSPSISVGFLVGIHMGAIKAGYSYEMFTSKIGISNGSHDIYICYSMDMNFMSKSKNKHKSIRIL